MINSLKQMGLCAGGARWRVQNFCLADGQSTGFDRRFANTASRSRKSRRSRKAQGRRAPTAADGYVRSDCECGFISAMNRYHFLTLWHRPTLSNDSAEPFAVIVELREDAHHELFGILKSLSGDDPTSVGGHVLANLPEILTERILAIAKYSFPEISVQVE